MKPAEIKANIDRDYDKYIDQIKKGSKKLDDLLDLIGTEIMAKIDVDTDEIAQYRSEKLNELVRFANALEGEEEFIEDKEEDEDRFRDDDLPMDEDEDNKDE
jgi:hypothetical protein